MGGRSIGIVGRAGLAILAGLATACGGGESVDDDAADEPIAVDLAQRSRELAQSLLIVDTHVDLPYRLVEKYEDVGSATESGDFDYPRAKAGGLDAPFMSIYVAAKHQETGDAKEAADELIDLVEEIVERHPDKFEIVASPARLREVVAEGKIALPLGMENGAPLEGSFDNLRHFYDRGIRYITLTHSKANHISDSSYDENRKWGGLSPFGLELIDEMNRIGIMIDVSHVSDDAFWQAVERSRTPMIATHSSCREFTPGFERNMDDAMIEALARGGGAIMINFGSYFLTQEWIDWAKRRNAAIEHAGLERHTPDGDAFVENWSASNPPPYATVSDVADHIDHVVGLVGVDHVGFGSDFDGVGDSLPVGLKDASGFPNLIEELLRRGYSEEEIEKIASGNLMRIWEAVEWHAADAGGA